jgi:hypothetical protein
MKSFILLFCLMLNGWAGQVVITHGGTYTLDANSVHIQTTEVVTLEGCGLMPTDSTPAVYADPGSRVVVDHCTISCLGPAQGVFAWAPVLLIVENSWINAATIGVYVLGDPNNAVGGDAQISILQNRITDGGSAIQLNGIHDDPNISIHHNEITNKNAQKYPGDLVNIYRSSGTPGHPICIHNNYIQGATSFNSSGIVTDGDEPDPSLCTCYVDIAYNQVVGCPWTGIALAFGFDEVAHDNTVITSGAIFCGIAIEGDTRYQPEWMNHYMFFQNNTVGSWNTQTGQRVDVYLWYPTESGNVTGTISPHDGMITMADEQLQWTLWRSKIASSSITVGP